MISVLPIIDAYTLNSRMGRSHTSRTEDRRKRDKPVQEEEASFKKILYAVDRKNAKV